MRNLILTPTYNDWKSLNYTLLEIDKNISDLSGNFEVLIIDDASTLKEKLNKNKLKKLKNIKTLYLKNNLGSQKAIALGLSYIKQLKKNYIITILDSDGEDDPGKIKNLINLAKKNPNKIIVASRKSRTENFFLKFLNFIRLMITYIATGKYINFGNFSCFNSKNLKKILINNNIYIAYSSGLIKNNNKIIKLNIEKKNRYFGHSKVSWFFLIRHSINIISIFKFEIFIRSIILLIITFVFSQKLYFDFAFLILLLINLILSINYSNEGDKDYRNQIKFFKKI